MFKILVGKEERDYNEWVELWQGWEGKDIFAHPDYLSLYRKYADVCCATYQSRNKIILFPFCIRKVEQDVVKKVLYDIITPYGYGDIYIIGNGCHKQIMIEFQSCFEDWALNNNVVCEFIRFSLNSKSVGSYKGKVIQNNVNLVCDLSKGESAIWNEFETKVRRNIRKAQKFDLKIKRDFLGEYSGDFLSLYNNTMDRLKAQRKYYLEEGYFHEIHKKLQGNFGYFYVTSKEIPIAAAFVLISDHRIYFFLGGSDEGYLYMRPNDLLHFEIIKWGISKRKNEYVLGGGYNNDDSLYKFKKGFSPEGIVPFYVGTNIYNKDVYMSLCAKDNAKLKFKPNNGINFPEYRVDSVDYLI